MDQWGRPDHKPQSYAATQSHTRPHNGTTSHTEPQRGGTPTTVQDGAGYRKQGLRGKNTFHKVRDTAHSLQSAQHATHSAHCTLCSPKTLHPAHCALCHFAQCAAHCTVHIDTRCDDAVSIHPCGLALKQANGIRRKRTSGLVCVQRTMRPRSGMASHGQAVACTQLEESKLHGDRCQANGTLATGTPWRTKKVQPNHKIFDMNCPQTGNRQN